MTDIPPNEHFQSLGYERISGLYPAEDAFWLFERQRLYVRDMKSGLTEVAERWKSEYYRKYQELKHEEENGRPPNYRPRIPTSPFAKEIAERAK